jgi:hypothetical protein
MHCFVSRDLATQVHRRSRLKVAENCQKDPTEAYRSRNYLIYWRSLRDSNPCYSLERAFFGMLALTVVVLDGYSPFRRAAQMLSRLTRRLTSASDSPDAWVTAVVRQSAEVRKRVAGKRRSYVQPGNIRPVPSAATPARVRQVRAVSHPRCRKAHTVNAIRLPPGTISATATYAPSARIEVRGWASEFIARSSIAAFRVSPTFPNTRSMLNCT